MLKKACIFLDRDGVLNYDRGDYSWLPEHFKLIPESIQALKKLKKAGFPMVVITNQAGISRGFYSVDEMNACHEILQDACDGAIDAFYYSPYHPSKTVSLSRKPGSLMFERAIAYFNCDPSVSWMIGDKERDLEPAKKCGLKTILVGEEESGIYDFKAIDLFQATGIILGTQEY
jgi:D-glycero-D-manno-heptose 1,7-bisphosphate phosphatase